MKTFQTFAFILALLAPSVGLAQQAAEVEETQSEGWMLGVAPRVGLTVPTTDLGPTVVGGLEIDVALPVLERRLVLALDAGLTRPGVSDTTDDPRVGGAADYDIKVTEFRVALDVIFRLFGPEARLVPFFGAGPFLHMLRSTETTSVAPGENTAQDTNIGFEGIAGVDFRLGPGYLLGEIRAGGADLDHLYTGDSNTGNVSIATGYRMVF